MRTNYMASVQTRCAIARALVGPHDAEGFAMRRWGAASPEVRWLQRSGVGDVSSSDLGIGTPESELFASFLAELPFAVGAFRQVGFRRRLLKVSQKLTGNWIGESKAIRVTRPSLDASTLETKKFGAITFATKESLEDLLAETMLDNELRGTGVAAVVAAFLDPDNDGSGDAPKAITHSSVSTHIASSGEPSVDVAEMFDAFTGDLSQAVIFLDPTTAVQMGMARDSAGNYAFPKLGARGGEICGVPAYTFTDIPRNTNGGHIALVDPGSVAYAVSSINIERARHATIEADDAPQGASDAPVAASANVISLFQLDLVAFKVIVEANWEAQRGAGSVVTVRGASYSASQT